MADRPILVFDINETLLDLDGLRPVFARAFGDGEVMRAWFAQLVLYSEALTLAGDYADFGALGAAVLRMTGAVRGREVGEADAQALKAAVAAMPPHPEVPAALERLKAAGYRLVTLGNNPAATTRAQLEAGGLSDLFERGFSVDDGVRRYKPAPETYRAVAQALGVETRGLCMVACHTWDTLGAVAAGCRAALITRPGNAPLSAGPQPDIVGADLAEVADQIVSRWG